MIRNIFPLPKIMMKNPIFGVKDIIFPIALDISDLYFYKSVERDIIDDRVFYIERLLLKRDHELIPYKVKITERSLHIPKRSVNYCIIPNLLYIYRYLFPHYDSDRFRTLSSLAGDPFEFVCTNHDKTEIDKIDIITRTSLDTGDMDFSPYLKSEVDMVDRELFKCDIEELIIDQTIDYKLLTTYQSVSLSAICEIIEGSSITDFSISYDYHCHDTDNKDKNYRIKYMNRHMSPEIYETDVKGLTIINKLSEYIRTSYFHITSGYVKIHKSLDEKIYITITHDYEYVENIIIDFSLLWLFPSYLWETHK